VLVSCAGWRERHEAAPEGQKISTLKEINKSVQQILKGIVEGQYPGDSPDSWVSVTFTPEQVAADKENFASLQTAYKACVDETGIAAAGAAPLVKILETISELYPIDGALPNNQTSRSRNNRRKAAASAAALSNTLVFFEQIGVTTLQDLIILPRPENPVSLFLTCT
jgi:hypothetical protein